MYALLNATIYCWNQTISDKALIIDNEIIVSIADPEDIPAEAEILDYTGLMIVPGLIDLQIAGAGGYLFSENPMAEALNKIADSIIKTGTTGFLIAVPTNSFSAYSEMFRIIRDNPHPAVLGLHLEGPYINKSKGGAHNTEYIKLPDIDELRELLDMAGDAIKMMTIAPELCDREFINVLTEKGITVAAGHSNASFVEAMEGFNNGVRTTTHLFNAMSGFHHRDPGLPGATFVSENACASIIADGIHVSYSTLSIAKMIMKERLYLVSDAVEENKTGAYRHQRRKDRFTLPNGTLSGSNLSMLDAVRNCVRNAGIPLEEALRMASTYPARLIKSSNYGIIAPGSPANLIVLTKNLDLKHVIIGGDKYF